MRIHVLKVRPKKAAQKTPCATELAALLACWASTGSVMGGPILGIGTHPKLDPSAPTPRNTHLACAEAMRGLEQCMRTATAAPKQGAKSAINYHLGKWSKQL